MNRTLDVILEEHRVELPMADAYVFDTDSISPDGQLFVQLSNLLDAVDVVMCNYILANGSYQVSEGVIDHLGETWKELNT